jgi:hypothetical protein
VLRFAWAYQGSGAATYIAGGAEITVSVAPGGIDIASGDALDINTGGLGIEAVTAGKALDLNHDGYTVDL